MKQQLLIWLEAPEACAWIFMAALVYWYTSSTISLLVLGQLLLRLFVWSPIRHPDRQGVGMSVCLVPCLVSLMKWPTDNDYYASLVAVGSFWQFIYKDCYCRTTQNNNNNTFTRGEAFVIGSLAAGVAIEFLKCLWHNSSSDDDEQQPGSFVPRFIYAFTAVAGLVGCGLACAVSSFVAFKSVPLRLGTISVVALGFVEACFWRIGATAKYAFPKCLTWIFGDFLMRGATENSGGVPQGAWLLYWVGVMAVTIPLAPSPTDNNTMSPILARKWFHLVAVLLFCPATVYVPQLLSLSYAVALALLLVLETTRHSVPWLQQFYKTYVDTSKQETADTTIVSHMALIVGCAAPLWIAQWIDHQQESSSQPPGGTTRNSSLLLALFGVWTLGVGDAMAAVVGTKYGKWRWGHCRTVEGSAAMFVSLCMVCYFTEPGSHYWLPAAVFVTILEAFTVQIDNLVLPLAGVAILLLFSG